MNMTEKEDEIGENEVSKVVEHSGGDIVKKENAGIDDPVVEVKEKTEDSMNNKDSLSPQKEQSTEIKNSNKGEEENSPKVTKVEKVEITKTEEQSPVKVELQSEKVIDEQGMKESPDKKLISNETQPNVSEFKNELLIEGMMDSSPGRHKTKSATTAFLQSETTSNSPPNENVEFADEALAHDV